MSTEWRIQPSATCTTAPRSCSPIVLIRSQSYNIQGYHVRCIGSRPIYDETRLDPESATSLNPHGPHWFGEGDGVGMGFVVGDRLSGKTTAYIPGPASYILHGILEDSPNVCICGPLAKGC